MLPRIKKHVHEFFKHNEIGVIVLILFCISFIAFFYFFQQGMIIAYGDAVSRLNISRKIVDNLTPGLAQVGSVWLPLPQVLMLAFTWNSYLWHTGIAGALVSMISFIVGGLYLYKTAKIISNSYLASIFALSIYALNINLLYLQTTAMSEPIFICSVILTNYFFVKWIREKKIYNLILAGAGISAATLIRYEALALLFSSIPLVFFYSWINTKKYKEAEGNTVLYSMVAMLGFGIWTIYLTFIFGDPLYWKNYYIGTHTAGDANTQLHTFTHHLTFFEALWKYVSNIIWMNGLVPTILAFLGLPILAITSFRNKTYYFIPILISFSMFAFMILTLMRNTPINQPELTIANLTSSATHHFNEFNIRYGMMMMPIVALLSVYLFRTKYLALKLFVYVFLFIHLLSYFNPSLAIIFNLPTALSTSTSLHGDKMTAWLNEHYDGGLIMISALKHDPQMFHLGYNYSTFIHEGTDRYWKESIKRPQKYASWIVFDSKNPDDQVTKFLKESTDLELYFNRVYEDGGLWIYKIKNKPDVIVQK